MMERIARRYPKKNREAGLFSGSGSPKTNGKKLSNKHKCTAYFLDFGLGELVGKDIYINVAGLGCAVDGTVPAAAIKSGIVV